MGDTPRATSNVLPFHLEDRKKSPGACAAATGDWVDSGPSPDESLRMIRAFLGIKNRKSRENMIELLEGVSRSAAPAPGPVNK